MERGSSSWSSSMPTSMKHSLDAAALEAAGHDESLDFGRALPDPVDAELAEEALGHVRAEVAAPAESLNAAVGAYPRALRGEELCHRSLVVDEPEVGATVRKQGDLEGEKPRGGSVG